MISIQNIKERSVDLPHRSMLFLTTIFGTRMPKVVKKREEVSEVDEASVITLYKAGHSERKIVAQTEIAKPNVHCTGNLSLMIRNIKISIRFVKRRKHSA